MSNQISDAAERSATHLYEEAKDKHPQSSERREGMLHAIYWQNQAVIALLKEQNELLRQNNEIALYGRRPQDI